MMIESCFMNEQPDFFYEVYDENQNHIATIRALTPEDEDIVRRKARFSFKNTNDGDLNYDIGAYENYHILLSLGGKIGSKSYKKGDEGLKFFDKNSNPIEIDENNVGLLMPEIRFSILESILKHKQNWEANKKAIERN